jgi:hypothetical protein
MHGPFAQGLQQKGWTARQPGRNWVHQDPLFTCGRCARNGLQCVIPRIERTRWDEVNRPVYRMSKCLACQKSNTLGGCSLVGPPWPQLEYHWTDEGRWERKTVVWRMGLAGFWQPRPKAGLLTLKKDERVGTEEGKALEHSTSTTVIPSAGPAGGEPHTTSDSRPLTQDRHEGSDDNEPTRRLHPNSPALRSASPPSNTKYDPDQPVSQLPSLDPFSDSNGIPSQSSQPSSSGSQYVTPPARRYRQRPKNSPNSRDRRSRPIILPTDPLNDRRPRPVPYDGSRHLIYDPIHIPEGLLPPFIPPEPSNSIMRRRLGQMTTQDLHAWLDNRLPPVSLDSVDKVLLGLVHQLMEFGLTRPGVRLTPEPRRAAHRQTSSELVEREEAPESDDVDEPVEREEAPESDDTTESV